VRGVAAIFYAAIVIDSHALPAGQQRLVVWTTIACVMSSIIIHGLTSTPLTHRLLDPTGTPPE
ncbi:MAG: hypothetical protein ABSG43_26975, partial [Solirubrobacteraceae bacterium]